MNAIAPTLNDRTSFRLPVRIAVVLCIICALAFSMVVPASAATIDSIEDGIKNCMQEALKQLRVIVTVIAIVGLLSNFVIMLFGGQKGMETGKKVRLMCVLAIAAVWLAPLFFEAIASLLERAGDSSVFSTTPSSTP